MNPQIHEIHDLESREFQDAMALYHATFRGPIAETTASIEARLLHHPFGKEHLLVATQDSQFVGLTISSYIATKNYGFISYITSHP